MADSTTTPHIYAYSPPYDPTKNENREYRWITKEGENKGKGCTYKLDQNGEMYDFRIIPNDHVYHGVCQKPPNKDRKFKCVKGVDGQFLLFKWMTKKE